MVVVTAVTQRLEGFPQDLSDFQLPSPPTKTELADIISHLNILATTENTPKARHSIAQVAALLPPEQALEGIELAWALDQGASVVAIDQHVASGLAQGVYDGRKWIRELAAAETPRGRDVLVAWGSEHFDDFLDACQAEFVNPTLRIGILRIVVFLLLDAPYSPDVPYETTLMYRFAAHTFFTSLLHSLLLDTNNQLFPVALSALNTVLPFSLQLWTPHVPLLMVVIGRAICWRDRPFTLSGVTKATGTTPTPKPNPDLNWVVSEADTSIAPTHTEKIVVQLTLIGFYGAWPSNLVGFVRNPDQYLVNKNIHPVYDVPWKDVWQPGLLGSRTLPLINGFQLHPSIIQFTSEEELKDDKRWDKYDPSEFASKARIMSRTEDDPNTTFQFFTRPAMRLDPLPTEVTDHDPALETANFKDVDDVARLKEENELLRLEAMYNRRLGKQYLYHIGRLHKNSLRFNTDEAEIHTFLNKIKELTKTIATMTAELSQQRSEATQAQQKHVKWQEQLRDKVSSFREERRAWQTEATKIRSELSEANAMAKRLRDELAEVRNKRFVLENQLLEVTPKVRHIADYETRIKQLTDTQMLWDSDILKLREAEAAVEELSGRVFELEKMLESRDKLVAEQASSINKLEKSRLPSPVPTPPPKSPNQIPSPSFYINVADNTKKRCEKLERENLELNVEIERLRRLSLQTATGDVGHSLIYGGVEGR
ncbi:hypothetical protein Q8F55_006305 [Vanrija albida]|uniref:Hamartin n=1 Tax=Vanrija albida TaxID=181172 RepID=A0ABR3PXM6_9TREE